MHRAFVHVLACVCALSAAACGDDGSNAAAPDPNNAPPTALLAVPLTVAVGRAVTIDASASSDSDGYLAEFIFELGEGAPLLQSPDPVLVHTFLEPGDIDVAVTVIDDDGTKDTARAVVRVTP